MKKWITGIGVIIGVILFPKTVQADSPITSTDFHRAYADVAIVSEAAESGEVNQKIADFLADESNPIDIKAAVINALSWGPENKHNAELYIDYIYDTTFEGLDPDILSGDQLFCIGYMRTLDYYFEANPSADYLKRAEEKLPGSFTAAIIAALADAMSHMDQNLWDLSIRPILNNSELTMDMRQEAVTIITDYMKLYNEEWAKSILPRTGEEDMSIVWAGAALIMGAGLLLAGKNNGIRRKIK